MEHIMEEVHEWHAYDDAHPDFVGGDAAADECDDLQETPVQAKVQVCRLDEASEDVVSNIRNNINLLHGERKRLLADCRWQADQHAMPPRNHDLSLIVHDSQVGPNEPVARAVNYVFWGDAANRLGWPVRLDTHNRIKYCMPWIKTRQQFLEVEFLCANLPVTMHKTTAAKAETMPRWAQVFKCIAETTIYSGPCDKSLIDNDIWPSCVYCEVVGHELSDALVWRCCTCLSVWHAECYEAFVCSSSTIVHHPFLCPLCR